MSEQDVQQAPQAATAQAGGGEASVEGEPQASAASFTSQGAIPPVASAASANPGPTASERAFAASTHGHAHHGGVRGGIRNVSMQHINTRHIGEKHQTTRLSIGGKMPVIAKSTHVYGNDGQPVAPVGKGPISVNAGQICELVIAGTKTTCVLTHGGHPGWVPVDAFEHASELRQVQHHQSGQIDHERHAAHDRARSVKPQTVFAKPTPALYEQLFTKPDEKGDANHAHDYFLRGSGTANLLLNIPTWSAGGGSVGERFGSASDIVKAAPWPASHDTPPAPESEFYQTEGPVQVPLFHHGSTHPSGHHITFVYGYVINNAGEKRLGWINQYLLGH